MTDRRQSILLWVAYAAAFLITRFFATGIFGRFPLLGGVPNAIPVAIALVAVGEGSVPGSIFGLCAGLFGYLAPGGGGASLIMAGALEGMTAGFFWQQRPRHPFRRSLLACLCAVAIAELKSILGGLLLGSASLGVLLRIALPEGLYSLLLALPAYLLFRFVRTRCGNY
jgi:hypothetical protein